MQRAGIYGCEEFRKVFMRTSANKVLRPSLLLEIDNLEVEHVLACVATCFWAQAVWTGTLEDDMRDAWKGRCGKQRCG